MQPMGLRFSDEALPAAYDRLFTASFFGPWARALIDVVGVQPGDAVLDVATGPGTVARVAAARAGTSGRVVGIDLRTLTLVRGMADWLPGCTAASRQYGPSTRRTAGKKRALRASPT